MWAVQKFPLQKFESFAYSRFRWAIEFFFATNTEQAILFFNM